MSRPTIAMFDLENTLIDSWNSVVPLTRKIEVVKHALCTFKNVTDYGVFSYAVDFAHEKPQAISMAEFTMHCKINPELVPCFKELEGLISLDSFHVNKHEIVQAYGKSILFPIFCAHHPESDFVLFDDALAFDRETIVRCINGHDQTVTMIRV